MGTFMRELADCGTTALEDRGQVCDQSGLSHQLSPPARL